MRWRILISLLALALASPAVEQASAQVSMKRCIGAPSDYVARYDTERLQSANGRVDYPENRVYLSFQSWLTPVGVDEGHNSEHVHVEGCFIPPGGTWNQPNEGRYLDLVVRFHDFKDYKVTNLAASYHFCTPTSECGQNDHASQRAFRADLDDPGFLTEATAAGNASGHTGATSVFRSFHLEPATFDGKKEIRLVLTTEATCNPNCASSADLGEALVLKWKLDARLYATDNYGLPEGSIWSDNPQRNLGLRTIVDHFKTDGVSIGTGFYHHSRFDNSYSWSANFFDHGRTGSFAPQPLVTDGGGPGQYEVDPDHHSHDESRGAYFEDFYLFSPSGPNTGPVVCPDGGDPVYFRNTCPQAIPLDGLTPGLHKLFFGSDDEPDCVRNDQDAIPEDECPAGVRPKWRNVVVIPFRKL